MVKKRKSEKERTKEAPCAVHNKGNRSDREIRKERRNRFPEERKKKRQKQKKEKKKKRKKNSEKERKREMKREKERSTVCGPAQRINE